jgi:spermidine synthase
VPVTRRRPGRPARHLRIDHLRTDFAYATTPRNLACYVKPPERCVRRRQRLQRKPVLVQPEPSKTPLDHPPSASPASPSPASGQNQASVDNFRTHVMLLVSTFTIAVCGLIYELLAGTVSSYLLGDSVYQFSLVIGLFMAAMGIGAYLSRFVGEHLSDVFIWTQIAIGLIGGSSAIILFFAFSHIDNYEPFLVILCVAIGALVGLEIPLVIRLLRDNQILKLNVSNVLTVDYIGALVASLLFPLVLVPQLGLMRTGLLFGLLNIVVAALALYTFRDAVRARRNAALATALVGIALGTSFIGADRIADVVNTRLYAGEIIHSQVTPYQQIVVTKTHGTTSLFINGALQFSSLDEYRYHEALVHPALSLARHRARVLILGGGDGLAVREVLKHSGVEHITVVDIDPAITTLFKDNRALRALNGSALSDPRVEIVNADAAKFLESTDVPYDIAILDLPDPHSISVSRLYTLSFYTMLRSRLSAHAIIVTQATSPLYAPEAFWSIEHTLASAGDGYSRSLKTIPYHTYVPTFGDWGFILASTLQLDLGEADITIPTRYLTNELLSTMSVFPPDMSRVPVEANTLDSHVLTSYYERGWSKWYK